MNLIDRALKAKKLYEIKQEEKRKIQEEEWKKIRKEETDLLLKIEKTLEGLKPNFTIKKTSCGLRNGFCIEKNKRLIFSVMLEYSTMEESYDDGWHSPSYEYWNIVCRPGSYCINENGPKTQCLGDSIIGLEEYIINTIQDEI